MDLPWPQVLSGCCEDAEDTTVGLWTSGSSDQDGSGEQETDGASVPFCVPAEVSDRGKGEKGMSTETMREGCFHTVAQPPSFF